MIIKSPETEKEWQEYYELRYRVLRKPLNQPLGSERNEGDVTGKHFALYDEGILVAIGRLDTLDTETVQARFVAVSDKFQRKGYGRIIMEAMESHARMMDKKIIILHARDYAIDFYLELGYIIVEKSHVLFGVLQHYLMEKRL